MGTQLTSNDSSKVFAIGVTGATGTILAYDLVRHLLDAGHFVHLTVSRAGKMVIADELSHVRDSKSRSALGIEHERLREWGTKTSTHHLLVALHPLTAW